MRWSEGDLLSRVCKDQDHDSANVKNRELLGS